MTDRSNTLMRRSPMPIRGLFGSALPDLFNTSPFLRNLDMDMDNLFNNTLPQYRRIDGGYEYEFNLAGFGEDDISIQIDPKTDKLHVEAKTGEDENSRVASYTMTLMNEGKLEADHVSTRYTNGLLIVTVKDDASTSGVFTIPLSHSKAISEEAPDQSA